MERIDGKTRRSKAGFGFVGAPILRAVRKARFPLLFAAGLALCTFAPAATYQPVSAEKPIPLTFGKSLEIGRQGSIFGTIASVCEDRDRNIYVLDGAQFTVFVFSPQGKLIRKFGAKGQGPGDFQSPSQILIDRQGELVVMEDINFISFFRTDGTFLRRLDLNGLLGATYVGPDRFLGWTWTPDSRQQVLVDGKNRVLVKLGSQPRSSFSTTMPDATGRAVMFNYSSPDYVPELISAPGERMAVVGFGGAYRLTIIDGDGNTAGAVSRDIEPGKISSKERAFLEGQIRDTAKERNWPPAVTKEISKKIPSTKPFFRAVRISPNAVWVFRVKDDITRPDAPFPVDLFSLKGEYLGSTGVGRIPIFISASRMYFVETDESDAEYVRAAEYGLELR